MKNQNILRKKLLTFGEVPEVKKVLGDDGHIPLMSPQKQVKGCLIEEFNMLYHLLKFEEIDRFWTNCPLPVLDSPSNCLLQWQSCNVSNDCWSLEGILRNEQEQSKFGCLHGHSIAFLGSLQQEEYIAQRKKSMLGSTSFCPEIQPVLSFLSGHVICQCLCH